MPNRDVSALLRQAADALNALARFTKDSSANYDHDADAHIHGTPCRVCEAEGISDLYGDPADAAALFDLATLVQEYVEAKNDLTQDTRWLNAERALLAWLRGDDA